MSTIDKKEISKFDSLSFDWWNEKGSFKSLHKINPIRLNFIKDSVEKYLKIPHLNNLDILDIGCGGGLVCEPLAKMKANVTGIDASKNNIAVAIKHSEKAKLQINYLVKTAEDLTKNKKKFDVICALEIVEHVDNLELFISSCCSLLKENGILIISTLNRTVQSYLLGILVAEYLLKWVPKGTHKWKKFLKPYEIFKILENHSTKIGNIKGINFNLLHREWYLSDNIDTNYIFSTKPS